jgi:hypothetical protein
MSVLSKYEGEGFLFKVVEAIISKYPDKKTMNSVFLHLAQTGVVTGEDGFVIAYKAKKDQIKLLKIDSMASTKRFATEYEKYLDSRIVFEQKRAEESIEIRKREFNA